jgi:hypothetical protein
MTTFTLDDQLFSFAPFAFDAEGDPSTFNFEAARDAAVAKMVRLLMRSDAAADRQIQRRLQRWLHNALTAIATPLPSGERLSFADLRVILNVLHPLHPQVMVALQQHLPSSVQLDFEFLHSIQRLLDQDKYLESTLNRINEFTSAIGQQVFGNNAPPIDLQTAIRKRHFIVVNLRETKHLPREVGRPIADFMIHAIRNFCSEAPADERVPHHLIIDEASEFLGDDLGRFLDEARKWKLSVCLAAQQISNFRRGDIDISGQVLGHCKTFISFQQRNLEDVEILSKHFAYPNLILQERQHVMNLADPAADEIIELTDTSTGVVRGAATSLGRSHADTKSEGVTLTEARSHAESKIAGKATSESRQTSTQIGEGHGSTSGASQGTGAGHGAQFLTLDGRILQMPTASTSQQFQNIRSDTLSDFESHGTSEGSASTVSMAEAITNAISQASGRSLSKSETDALMAGISRSLSQSFSTSKKKTLVQRSKEYWYGTGDARYALPYQYVIHEYLLNVLPDQYAFMRAKVQGIEQTVLIRVAEPNTPVLTISAVVVPNGSSTPASPPRR